ncbi:MAG: cysteine desulfurase [Thermoplasmatota archaeon]
MSGQTQETTPAMAAYDVAKLRADFPALHQDVRGKPLAYLDNAATTQKPRAVLDAMARYYEEDNANVHRGVHALSERATAAYEGARDTLQRFIGAGSRKEVVMTRGTTEAINLVAASFVRPRLEAGDEVLITHLEHHSNIVPWQLACAERGATLKVAPLRDDGSVDLDAFQELLGPRTKFTSVAHVSNALGTVNPVREMVDAAHAAGSPILLDGAQAAPHLAVDVAALDCDFYTVSAHKMYGPTGIGLLYGKEEHLDAMPPYQGGGDMIRSVTFDGTTYNDLPYKFEAGTPNIAGTIGFGAAADYLTAIGLEAVAAHEHDLLEHATDVVGGLDGVRVIGTAPGKAAVLSFVLDDVHPHDVGTLVDQEGIAIRTGHHCAQPVMAHFGVPATCRASFGIYNTKDEVDRLAAAIGKVQEMFS